MKALEEKILKEGKVYPGNILKVGSFLNHQIDVAFANEMGKEFYRLFKDEGINKILTIEASGIGIACIVAQYFNCNVVFAKKTKTKNIDDENVYTCSITSFTRGTTYEIMVEKTYINSNDKILIIDDFLAKGEALNGLVSIAQQAGAKVKGCGIVIEKVYQDGGKRIRDMGIRVESLARVASMDGDNGTIIFCD
ncbi:MAG: xanthine phosphoribosyltransferase [Ruminococcaceae bacterium]|nr:xanthine phosphoribosyltransferase [Oscillospiraceae bacterium]